MHNELIPSRFGISRYMSKVRTSAYRQTPTPEGLKAIENGTLDYFDTEMYANFNTEVLEEYLEEKNNVEMD